MAPLRAKHYTRRTFIVPSSTPKRNEVSSRKHLSGPLRISVHDYTVSDADSNGITIILMHGTSFNKYFWELIIAALLERPELRRSIKRFISFDAANHGDSALLNRVLLPQKGSELKTLPAVETAIKLMQSAACWADDSRDILTTLKTLRAEQPILGIGHSFGGGALCHAAMMESSTFLATIFVEPILFQMKAQTEAVAQMALRRRDVWNSKGDVSAAFKRNPSLRDWNERQLSVYIDHGTYSMKNGNPESRVHLKTPKNQEAATYLAAPHPEILQLIEHSRGRHHFIWGADSKVINPENRESVEQLIRAPSTSQVVPGAGHLIPMTHPDDLSRILGDLIIAVAEFRPKGKL